MTEIQVDDISCAVFVHTSAHFVYLELYVGNRHHTRIKVRLFQPIAEDVANKLQAAVAKIRDENTEKG